MVFGRDRFTLNSLELGCDVGIGTVSVEPVVSLRMSRDGQVYGNAQTRGMGLSGERTKRVRWSRLGQWDKCHIRIDISDAYKRAVYAAYADVTQDDR